MPRGRKSCTLIIAQGAPLAADLLVIDPTNCASLLSSTIQGGGKRRAEGVEPMIADAQLPAASHCLRASSRVMLGWSRRNCPNASSPHRTISPKLNRTPTGASGGTSGGTRETLGAFPHRPSSRAADQGNADGQYCLGQMYDQACRRTTCRHTCG